MPVTPEDIKKKATIFDAIKGKSLYHIFDYVVHTAFKGLTGKDVTLFQWIGKGNSSESDHNTDSTQ